MIEKYRGIERGKAYQLLRQMEHLDPMHRGIDRCAFLVDGYAVLASNRMKWRNYDIRDEDLSYLDDVIIRLEDLKESGVNVVPVLGYCCDEESEDGHGFLFEQCAKGSELYDDAIICRYQIWTQGNQDIYLNSDADAAEYIVRRTGEIAQIPQEAFDKFISDILAISKKDILIDFNGKSNFFYDPDEGFQFIDLDCHTDEYYGLTKERISPEAWAALGGFVPCHFAADTDFYKPVALDDKAINEIEEEGLKQLAEDNLKIYDKCLKAIRNNDIPDEVIDKVLSRIRVFGQ